MRVLGIGETNDLAAMYLALQQRYLPPALICERPDFSPHRVIVFSVETLPGDSHARVEAPYVFVGPAQGEGRRPVDFPWAWLRPATIGCSSTKLCRPLARLVPPRTTRQGSPRVQATAPRT